MAEFERFYSAQPRMPLVVPADGAKVLIVKFNDYQCPACGESFRPTSAFLRNTRQAIPGAVRLVTQDFPLESECNTGGHASTAALRGGGGRAAGARQGPRRGARGVAVH